MEAAELTNLSEAVRAWYGSTMSGASLLEGGFDSVHIDDLFEGYAEERAVEIGVHAFDELVRCYSESSLKFMAMLVISLGCEDEMIPEAPTSKDLGAVWDHLTPPELYLIARGPRLTPYVVEEYRKPYTPDGLRVSRGECHSYYRCHRQGDSVEFTRAVYVEHYPTSV